MTAARAGVRYALRVRDHELVRARVEEDGESLPANLHIPVILDGVRAVRVAQAILSPDPEERRDYSPYSLEAYQRTKAERASVRPAASPILDISRRHIASATCHIPSAMRQKTTLSSISVAARGARSSDASGWTMPKICPRRRALRPTVRAPATGTLTTCAAAGW